MTPNTITRSELRKKLAADAEREPGDEDRASDEIPDFSGYSDEMLIEAAREADILDDPDITIVDDDER